MIKYQIAGRKDLLMENLVLDYNGTIAVDGKLIVGVEELVNQLAKDLKIYILTADTYGTVEEECKNINGQLLTFPNDQAGQHKKEIVEKLGAERTIAIGNGFNDIAMVKIAGLSLAIIEAEGACGQLIGQAHILVRNIKEALNIIANPNMVKATLRS